MQPLTGEEAQDGLIARLKKFAEAAAFATRVAQYGTDKRHYLVQFWRGDVYVKVTNPWDDLTAFSVGIYRTRQMPVPTPHLDAVISDIRDVINEVPGATIKNIKKSNE
jgi:hypothetical protein